MGQPPVNFAVSTDSEELVAQHLFQQRRLWLRLAAYRPLLLVAGVWVVLLAIALVAYGRLTATGVQSSPKPREPYPHEQVQLDQLPPQAAPTETPEATAEPELTSPPESAPENAPANDPEAPSGGAIFPGWSLGLLVALCAGGCLALSQQLNAPARKRSKRKPVQPRPRVRPQAAVPVASKSAPEKSPKRMQPYRPIPGATDFAPVPQPERPSAAATVTVVPDAQAHTLDWSKDSLINAMDVRQRHSVSSWLSS